MDSISSALFGMFGDGSGTILGLLVFLAVGTLSFVLMAALRVRVPSNAVPPASRSMSRSGPVRVRARCGIQA